MTWNTFLTTYWEPSCLRVLKQTRIMSPIVQGGLCESVSDVYSSQLK